MKVSRSWAMPNRATFTVKPIAEFVRRRLTESRVSIDPFARNNGWATYTNDLDPKTNAAEHKEARTFLRSLVERGIKADLIIFDPPYSPRQVSECYKNAGLRATQWATQNARMNKECRELFRLLAAPGCIVLSFGWNSTGMGAGWSIEELLLVNHGAAHNDTICLAERLTHAHPNTHEA